MYTLTYDLDMVHGGVPLVIPISQKDVGETLVFNLYLNGQEFAPSGSVTATIECDKPDGTYFSKVVTYNVEGIVTVSVDQQMAAVAGKVKCEIRLAKDSKNVGSANFVIDVEEAPLPPNAVTSQTEIPLFQQLVTEAMGYANSAEEAASKMVYGIRHIQSLSDQTLWRSIYNSVSNTSIAIGSYHNANKTDSYTGDTSGYHLVVIIKPADSLYGKIIVFVNDSTAIHVGKVQNNIVTWDK